jgi:hypothetical protein
MPGDYPEQSYYVSAKLRLTIRFDEFGQQSLPTVPVTILKNLNGTAPPKAPLLVITDPTAPAGTTRYLLTPTSGGATAQVATAQSSSSDGLTFDVTVIPKQMDWMVNGLRTASTLHAGIKLRDCPIDPRTIRSCAVEAFLGSVTSDDFAAGIAGATRSGATISGQGEPLNCLPDTYVDANGTQRTNSRFLGWVDKWAVEWVDKDEPMIHLECRDNTQLLIDQEAPAKLVVDMTKPIDQAVAGYLSNFNQLNGMSVQFLPSSDTPPVLQTVLANTAYRPQLGPQPARGGGTTGKLSIWDYLTDLCGAVACSIRVEGTTVVIQRPRAYVSNTAGPRPDDPYQGRTLPSGLSLPYRTFIYGRNVLEMHQSRNFTKNVPLNIEVRSYCSENKTLLVARFPSTMASAYQSNRLTSSIPGNASPEQKWLEFRVPEVKDLPTLQNIAQSIYEQLGRNELICEIKTKNLSSFGGGNLDPDILDMQFGDNFQVLTNQDPTEINSFTFMESQLQSQAAATAFLTNLGFSSDFAAAYASAYANVALPTLFRMKQMKVSWEHEDGISLHLVGINYIEARENRTLPAGQEPGTTSPTAMAPSPTNVAQSISNSGTGSS